MDQNSVSFRQGIPFYMGIASIAAWLFLLSASSWYNTLTAIIVFIAAGLILHLGWLPHMGTDTKDYDNGNGGGGRIFLDKPAQAPLILGICKLSFCRPCRTHLYIPNCHMTFGLWPLRTTFTIVHWNSSVRHRLTFAWAVWVPLLQLETPNLASVESTAVYLS